MSSPINRDVETGAPTQEAQEVTSTSTPAARRTGLIIAALLILVSIITIALWLANSKRPIRTDDRASVVTVEASGVPRPSTFDPTLR